MSDMIIIVIMFLVLILFKLWKIPEEIEIIVTGVIISTTCGYISLTIGDVILSQVFLILSILSILIILFLLILKYVSKIQRAVIRR